MCSINLLHHIRCIWGNVSTVNLQNCHNDDSLEDSKIEELSMVFHKTLSQKGNDSRRMTIPSNNEATMDDVKRDCRVLVAEDNNVDLVERGE